MRSRGELCKGRRGGVTGSRSVVRGVERLLANLSKYIPWRELYTSLAVLIRSPRLRGVAPSPPSTTRAVLWEAPTGSA